MNHPRRASILLVVAVLIVLCSLIASTAVYLADADQSSAQVQNQSRRLRALAWSGIQSAMVKIGDQRESLLAGGTPQMPSTITIFDDAVSGERGVIEFIPLSSIPGADEQRAAPEAAKLNINTADEILLSRLSGLDGASARKIAADRGNYASADEILPNLSTTTPGSAPTSAPPSTSSFTAPDSEDSAPPVLALVTATSWDAPVTSLQNSGRGKRPGSSEVTDRICLCKPLDAASREQLINLLSEPDAKFLEDLAKGNAPTKLSDVVAALHNAAIDPKRWGAILDAITTSPDAFDLGRIDVSRAPAQVLACIPGIDAAAADRIVSMRASLDASTLSSVTWPLTQGAMTHEQFAQSIDYLCARTLQWRIRVEARIEKRSDQTVPSSRRSPAPSDTGPRPPPLQRCISEAIIDVADASPRIAWMQDITHRQIAIREALSLASKSSAPGSSDAPSGIEDAAAPDASGPNSGPQPMDYGPPAPTSADEPAPDAGSPSPSNPPPRRDGRTGRWKVGS